VLPVTLGRPLQTLRAGGFTLIESAYAPSLALPQHGHDEAYLSFAVRGSFDERVGGKTFDCARYDVIVRPPGERHSNRYGEGGTRCVLVEIDAALLARIREHTAIFDVPARLRRDVQPIAMRIHRELMSIDAASALSVEGLVLELIGESSRRMHAKAPRWLGDARAYIHEHWPERPSLADIARAGGVHPSNLVRAFRAHLQCSPAEYMRRLRLEHAKSALASTHRTIAEVALEAGFYDQAHLTNAFRRRFGITPAQFVQAARRIS